MLTQISTRRSSETWEPDHNGVIQVCLLGRFRLVRNDQPLRVVVSGKAMTLLSLLALHLDDGVPRESLMDAIWPDQHGAQSSVSLHSLIYTLQCRLRRETYGATPMVYAHGSYFLNQDAGYSTDISRFGVLIRNGNRLVAASKETEAFASYERAVVVYEGDLSVGTDVSAVIERERLRADFLSVLAWLGDHAYRTQDYTAALSYALRLLGCDPCREDGHRVAMRAYVRRGQRAQALRQYRLCEHVLRREFDMAPEPLTTELFEQVRIDPANI